VEYEYKYSNISKYVSHSNGNVTLKNLETWKRYCVGWLGGNKLPSPAMVVCVQLCPDISI